MVEFSQHCQDTQEAVQASNVVYSLNPKALGLVPPLPGNCKQPFVVPDDVEL